MATQSMLLSGLHTTKLLVPMVSRLTCDLLCDMIGTHGLAYQMTILSRLIPASKILSLLAEILMVLAGLV